MRIERYEPEMRRRWDDFVRTSANGTFLLERGYMEYHADRFRDCSLLCLDEKDRIAGVLPANIEGTTLYSHQGLTYGGWISPCRHFPAGETEKLWTTFIDWMRGEGIRQLVYKPVPWIYCRQPAEDHEYWLWRAGARESVVQLSSVIMPDSPSVANETTRQLVKAAAKNGIEIVESRDFDGFIAMVNDRISERYGATAVHTGAEMALLASRFPENIRLWTARIGDEAVGGILVYITPRCIHAQYITTTERGRNCGAVAALVEHIRRNVAAPHQYLDFGTSNEQAGQYLNLSLIAQKYGLGARPILYRTLDLDL